MGKGNRMSVFKADTTTITLGDGVVVLKRQGKGLVTASVLGEELDFPSKGVKTLWLDRLIHDDRAGEDTLGGFRVHGAVVTQLEIPLQAPVLN